MEADMRTMVPTVAGLLTLAAISAQAAPLPPAKARPAELGTAPPIELVRQGCGWGGHRVHWRDRFAREAVSRVSLPESTHHPWLSLLKLHVNRVIVAAL
jgi:hypothetical protein